MTKEEKNLMDKLNISLEEARELIEYDKKVNKMSIKESREDLTEEQIKNSKKYTITTGEKKPVVYKLDNTKGTRSKKADEVKQDIIQLLFSSLNEKYENVAIINIERQLSFSINDDNFELTLTKKRKPKE